MQVHVTLTMSLQVFLNDLTQVKLYCGSQCLQLFAHGLLLYRGL